MAFADFLRDPLAMADFGDWLADLYLLDPDGATETLHFSRHGTAIGNTGITVGDDTLAANTPYRKRILQAPTWAQSLWAQGAILSRSFPNYGTLVLNNRDGGLDAYHPARGYVWSQRRATCYFGRGRAHANAYLASTIGRTVDGVLGRPSFKLSTVEVPVLGNESKFDQPVSQRVYRGSSYMLELFGDRTITYGSAPASVAITGSLTAECWLWLEALPTTSRTTVWGWDSTNVPWRIGFTTTGQIRVNATISGIATTLDSSLALSAKVPYHVAVVISGKDVTYYVWNDDTQTLTTETHTNVFSNATRDSNSGGSNAYVLRSASDATFKPWFDEARVWNVARTSDELASYRHKPIPDGAIPASCVHYARMDDGTGTSVTDSSATAANGTISGAGSSAWLWACEGTADLAGTPKPDVWGERFGVKPTLVGPFDNMYQVAGAGTIQAISAVFEGGFENYSYDGNASSLRSFITTAVSSGHALTYLARGLFKLGSSPSLPLACTVLGYKDGTLGYVETAGDIVWDIAERTGPKLDLATDVDDDSRDDFNAATSDAVCGEAVYDSGTRNLMDLIDLFARSGAGWWGYVRGSRLLHIERYAGPAVTADHNFDRRHIIEEPREIEWNEIGQVVVKYQHNDVVLTDDQVSGSVVGTTEQQRWQKEWLEERRTVPGADLSSLRVLEVQTALQNQVDAAALADYLYTTFTGRKRAWALVVKAVGLEVSMGDTCTISWTTWDGQTRLLLGGATKYIVLSVVDTRQQGRVALEVLSGATDDDADV